MPERPLITVTNRAWIPERSVPNALLDEFYYETTAKVQDDQGIWVDETVPIDLVVDSKCGKFLGFPRGDLNKVLRHFRNPRVNDKRSIAALGFPLELNREVMDDDRWPEQAELLAQWYAAGGGVLKAPAGSGKSVIGVAMTCHLGLRTLFLFDRKDFRDQWLDEFHRHTNLADLEQVAGEDLAGAFKAAGRRHLKVWPITFATFQQLNTPRIKRFMRDHRDYFGMIICDESLPYEAEVLTTTGYRPIGEIVEDPRSVQVVCFDGEHFTSREVTKKWVTTPKSPMVEVLHEKGSFRCTANHAVPTQRGDIPAGLLDPGLDSVVCITDKRTEDCVDSGVRSGGCPFGKAAQVQPGALSGQSQSDSICVSTGQVRDLEGLVWDTSKATQEQRPRRESVAVHDAIESRTASSMGDVLSRRRTQENRTRDLGSLLDSSDGSVVGDGRWQSQRRWGSSVSHRELYTKKFTSSCRVADGTRLPNNSATRSEILGALPVCGSLRALSGGSATLHTSLDALQDRACLRAIRNKAAPPLSDLSKAAACSDQVGRGSLLRQVQIGEKDFEGPRRVPWPRPGNSRRGHESVVLGVQEVETPSQVYDLSVAEHHNFVVRGVVLHNSHHVTSPTYRAAVLQFNPLVLGGVTATPERKDELEGIYYDVLGPITASGGSEQLNPLVWLIYTGFEVKPNPYRADHVQFTLFLNQIAKDRDRNALICTNVLRHLNKGRVPLIVSERVEHCHQLAKMLGDAWDHDRIAVAVGETKERKELYKGIDHGRYDCLIASKVIDEGVNVIRLDTLHLATPLASRSRIEQRAGRIRRQYTELMLKRWGKKPRPEIWDYIDEGHGTMHGSAYVRQQVYAKIGAEVRDRRTGLVVKVSDAFNKRKRRRW